MLPKKNISYQIRRNYRCQHTFIWTSKAGFIEHLDASRRITKKEIGACWFWWYPIPNSCRPYWNHEAMYNMQCINWFKSWDRRWTSRRMSPWRKNIVLKKAFGRILLTCVWCWSYGTSLVFSLWLILAVGFNFRSFSSWNSLNISLNVSKKNYEVTFCLNRGLQKTFFPFIWWNIYYYLGHIYERCCRHVRI